MLIAGVALIAVVVYDAISTTLVANSAAGPLTARVGGGLWWLAKRIGAGPHSRIVAAAGPAILVTTILIWMSMLWVGWWLVFSADVDAVVATASGRPADGWDRVYFAGYTVFTLGVGDFRPSGRVWQFATGLSVANGLAMATLAITYSIPVVTAVTERRQQAATITGLGSTAQELLVSVWDGSSLRFLDAPLMSFAADINRTAQRHLTYPILHFFHSPDRSDEFALSVTALDEALTITITAVREDARPHAAAVKTARAAIGRLLGILETSFHDAAEHVPPAPDLTPLRAAGIPVVDDALFHDRLAVHDERRRILLGFATSSSWPWAGAVVTSVEPSSRAAGPRAQRPR
ncbi:MAG: two pore domain potassium channel family protein [Actinobacteria bacterium]|nr:two pore domain potassium channel family protein [Actinomycetota bacterium]